MMILLKDNINEAAITQKMELDDRMFAVIILISQVWLSKHKIFLNNNFTQIL